MTTAPIFPAALAEPLTRLQENPLDAEAAPLLRARLTTETALPASVRATLEEVCEVLDGGARWTETARPERPPVVIDKSLHEKLVVHPHEKQDRRHQLASLLGRVLQLLDGNVMARSIATVTERATSTDYPRLCRLTEACAKSLEIELPDIHIARGQERICTALLDRKPFLCLHRSWSEPDSAAADLLPLTDAEMRFALGHQMEHIKKEHTAFLQVSPTKLESLVLDQVPFIARVPIQLASRALGWSRANQAMKRVSQWLPERSRSQRVAETVGDLLPDQNQETVLPEVVHEWVRSWLQGLEFSADRAGLLLSGSLAASAATIVRLSPDYAPQFTSLREMGARKLIQENADADRETASRLLELLRFTLSNDYLNFMHAENKP